MFPTCLCTAASETKPVVRDVPGAPLTFPWQAVSGITAACLVVLLAAAVAGAYALRGGEAPG